MKTLCLALLFILTACTQTPVSPTVIVNSIKTTIPLPAATIVSSPSTVHTPIVHLTTTPIPRWVEYESALANAILPKGIQGRCEWELLGQRGAEVYVWAMCFTGGMAGSMPAVVHLAVNGKIENVQVPRDGSFYSRDVRALFPPEVQEKVFAYQSPPNLGAHIRARLANPNLPPLIVVSGTPLP